MEFREVLEKASEYLPEKDIPLIERAYQFAEDSGKPYMDHAAAVASTLTHLQMDAESLAAAFLQGLPQDPDVPLEKTGAKFPPSVKKLVESIDKVNSTAWLVPDQSQSESLRKMFLAMAKDIRVIIISLANRLQLMRSLKGLDPETRKSVCEETLDIFVPLAHRLGIRELKSEMEDIAFRTLHPDEYREITNLLDVKQKEWRRAITHAVRVLRDEFAKAGLEADVEGRPKSVYSIYRKMNRYAEEGKEATDIHDLMAVRVLVNEVQDCYTALGIVHHLWHPLPGQFDDYIANPRENMYQSLHTTVMALQGKPLEIQIRTYDMHRINEYGVAAHWRYKEGGKKDKRFEEKMAWTRQLMEWQKDLSGAIFVEALRTDVFQDQVYVFTPKGEVKELPQGSTPLDFAYRIHTELGHRCTGAKVNGRLVPLTYQLQNGDVVDILSTKADRGPSLDWLNPDAGYVRSSHAREKIRQWFRRGERTENLERGRELFDREMKRLGLRTGLQDVADAFGYEDANDFLIAIGCGDINVQHIGSRLIPEEEEEEMPSLPAKPEGPHVAVGVQVLGVGDLLTHIARCCNPVPGDEIIGFVSRTKGVTIHRKDCPNITNCDEPERLVEVSWGIRQEAHPAAIVVTAEDRVGLLRDVTTVITEAKVNITSISSANHRDGTVALHLTIEITDIGQLSKLLSRLERLRGIISASRATRESRKAAA